MNVVSLAIPLGRWEDGPRGKASYQLYPWLSSILTFTGPYLRSREEHLYFAVNQVQQCVDMHS